MDSACGSFPSTLRGRVARSSISDSSSSILDRMPRIAIARSLALSDSRENVLSASATRGCPESVSMTEAMSFILDSD